MKQNLIRRAPVPGALLVWAGLTAAMSGQGTSDAVTVRDGVYSASQAERGREIYVVYCRSCHSADLSGGAHGDDPVPALRTDDFGVKRKTLDNLFTYVLKSMPRDEPGALGAARTADVVAFLLRENGLPAGPSDLPTDTGALGRIQMVRPVVP